MEIKVKCPAKINLDLKVFPVQENGFHPIKSIMQTISLFDYMTIKVSDGSGIFLSGNSEEIPYDEKNICYKAAKLFLESINQNKKICIYIDKNIPVCAGLAGGSTNASGVLFGLNKLLNNPLSNGEIHSLASKLGSDLNFCLEGGRQLCEGRGEKLTKLPFEKFELSLIKPKSLKISAARAYSAFDNLKEKSNMANDLEFALLNEFEELKYLHSLGFQMSGSGPTYFIKKPLIDIELDENFQVIENLKAVDFGVCEVK